MRPRAFIRRANGWTAASVVGAAAVSVPLLYVLSGLLRPANDNWSTVTRYLLADYAIGSAKLVLYTGFFAAFIGLALAWLVAYYRFPLRRFFRWALVLPLAVPPYIAAYTYSGMTGYTGVIQATLRNSFGVRIPPGTIEVMSERGAVFVLSLFLFPYVYLIVRAYLERHSASYIDSARLLGHSGLSIFVRVVLPLARPAIVGGVMLVAFEVLSDYGVATFFGVQTLTTAIFQTWFGMYDVNSAMRLAAWLMLAVIGALAVERLLRRNRQFHAAVRQSRPLQPRKLRGWRAAAACAACALVFLLAFALPVAQLVSWAIRTSRRVFPPEFGTLVWNSVSGALLATAVIMAIALVSARAARMSSSFAAHAAARLMTAGYAIPGAIVAIGVLAAFIALDEALAPLYARMGKGDDVLVLSLSLSMLISGYVVRFMATGYNAVEAGYAKIPRAYAEASHTLGRGRIATLFKVELPLLRGTVLTGFALTFVEIMKELPLTLLLRPFNFDTLATRAYVYASDERIFEAAMPSLLLVAVSLLSVMLLIKLEQGDSR